MIRLPPYKPATIRPVYNYSVTVDAIVLGYRVEFRPRRDAWYLSLWVGTEAICAGRRLVQGVPLLWRLKNSPPLPSGHLFLLSLALDGAELETEDGLGWSHCLYWAEPSDFAAQSTIPLVVT